MGSRRRAIQEIIELAVRDSEDSNQAVATLIACAHSILVTAGNSEVGALYGLHDVIDELADVYAVRTARAGAGVPS